MAWLYGWATLALPIATFCVTYLALGWHVLLAGASSLVVTTATMAILEATVPERALPPTSRVSRARDAFSGVVFGVILGMSTVAALWLALTTLRAAIGLDYRLELPGPVTVGLVLFLGDGLDYLRHRLEHASDGLAWRIHAVHHWVRHLTTMRGARIHPLESVLVYGSYGVVAGLLGADLEMTLVAAFLALLVMSTQHVNAQVELGPLAWILVHTAQHRRHHDIAPAAVCNFANVFTVWDLIGGTYARPDRFTGDYGMEPFRDDFPDGLWQQTAAIAPRRFAALIDAVATRTSDR